MTQQPQMDYAAPCLQGGGEAVFFRLQDLPEAARSAGEARDRFLMRAVGKRAVDIAIVARSLRPGTDVDYLQGRIAGEDDAIDWSGNCCSLSAAVASFALSSGFVHRERIPGTSAATVRIWQANIGKSIVATMPIPAAGLRLEFIDPAVQAGNGGSAIFPTGYLIDELEVPGVGWLQATLINAGAPTMFIDAAAIGHTGTVPPEAIEGKAEALVLLERIRACGAARMGLSEGVGDPARRPHLPAIVLVAPPADYVSAQGQRIAAAAVDLLARPVAPGRPCRSMPETAVVATAAAAAIPGTLASLTAGERAHGTVRLGHASGVVSASAAARQIGGEWIVVKVVADGCAPRNHLEMTHSD